MELLTAILFSLLFFLFLKLIQKSPEAKYVDLLPGPLALPLIGNLYQVFYVPKEKWIELSDNIGKTYGRIYRLYHGRKPEVHLLKAEYIEPILGNTKNLKKGNIYEMLHPWLGTGLLTSSGEKWFSHRKMITPTFHFKILETFVEIFNENSQILIKNLKKNSKLGKEFDIFPVITRCALDIICETAMGTKVNAQLDEDSEYVSAIYKISDITMKRHMKFWLYPDIIFYNSSLGKEYKNVVNILHGFSEKVIRERILLREKLTNTQDDINNEDIGIKNKKMFLDLLLDANMGEMNKLSTTDIREEVDTFMFEGHDTTTAAICWSISLLGNHPKIQEEVYEELKTIMGEDVDKQPTMKDLNEMKYLERVIKEALRLYPSVPFITRQLEEGLTIGQYYVPKNVQVILHIKEAHRDPEYFPDPDKFNPDHFLPENVQKRHAYAYVPFSAGPRNCIGQKFALLEEKSILSSLIRNYRIESLDKPEDATVLLELILRPVGGVRVKLYPRI